VERDCTAGPGAAGRPDAAAGRAGTCVTGRAAANSRAVTGLATRAIGSDRAIAADGTTVAPRALTKLLIVVRLLVIRVMLVTFLTLTLRK
jgi:hypothetical protein